MVKRSTIGCDPEFFLIDPKGSLVSAIGIVPGTKEEPHTLPNGGGLQVDNVALEFSTPIAKDGRTLVEILQATFKDVKEALPEGYSIVARPSAIFSDDQLDHPEAHRFGCEPDFDAWELEVNEKPEHPNANFRSCGGHIHVGHVPGDGNEFLHDPYGKVEVVKTMDLLHGIISTILDNSPEAIERRKLYGGAGCHRPTNYGVEYRVLSNFWMKSPQLVMLMDSLTQDALALVRDGKHSAIIELIGGDKIKAVINEGKVDDADMIIKEHLGDLLSKDSRYYLGEVYDVDFSPELEKCWLQEEAIQIGGVV